MPDLIQDFVSYIHCRTSGYNLNILFFLKFGPPSYKITLHGFNLPDCLKSEISIIIAFYFKHVHSCIHIDSYIV